MISVYYNLLLYLQQNGSILELFLRPIHCCWFATYSSAGIASSIWATGESAQSTLLAELFAGAGLPSVPSAQVKLKTHIRKIKFTKPEFTTIEIIFLSNVHL